MARIKQRLSSAGRDLQPTQTICYTIQNSSVRCLTHVRHPLPVSDLPSLPPPPAPDLSFDQYFSSCAPALLYSVPSTVFLARYSIQYVPHVNTGDRSSERYAVSPQSRAETNFGVASLSHRAIHSFIPWRSLNAKT